jgi:hypothetical protein
MTATHIFKWAYSNILTNDIACEIGAATIKQLIHTKYLVFTERGYLE